MKKLCIFVLMLFLLSGCAVATSVPEEVVNKDIWYKGQEFYKAFDEVIDEVKILDLDTKNRVDAFITKYYNVTFNDSSSISRKELDILNNVLLMYSSYIEARTAKESNDSVTMDIKITEAKTYLSNLERIYTNNK